MHRTWPLKNRIILAADLPTLDDNLALLEQVEDLIDVIKLPVAILLTENPGRIQQFTTTRSVPVFGDLKIADVPHTNRVLVRTAIDLGLDAVSVHGFIGPDGIVACTDSSNGDIKIIVQLELTSPGAAVFNEPVTLEMAEMVSGLDIFGVQAPGNRPARIAQIRRAIGTNKTVVSCGVGYQGGGHRDALNAGADYSIIGRAIYSAARPRSALQCLIEKS